MTRARGYTLIELMIAVGLFGLIASGALSLVMSASRSQAYSARADVAQSGLRAGIDFITRDLTGASGGASTGAIVDSSGAVPVVVSGVKVTQGVNAPDILEVYTIDASTMAYVMAPFAPTTPILSIDKPLSFVNGDFVLLSDPSLAFAVVLKFTANGAVNNSACTGCGDLSVFNATNTFPATAPSPFPIKSWVFKSRHVIYKILTLVGAGPGANGSYLTMSLNGGADQPLAEGIEDMQIALGFDNNPTDGVITQNGASANDDEWVGNVSGEVVPANLALLRAVRVTLVAKATMAQPGTFYPGRPTAEDHAAAAPDGFPRRLVRSVISVRNLSL